MAKSRSDRISPQDYKYMEQNPGDPGFDPEHNKRVIDETIKWTDNNYQKKKTEYDNLYKERANAVRHYLKSVMRGGESDIAKYFGRRELARLRGEEVLNTLKANKELLAKTRKKLSDKELF